MLGVLGVWHCLITFNVRQSKCKPTMMNFFSTITEHSKIKKNIPPCTLCGQEMETAITNNLQL